jgi:glycosyltransferase involved in cell wall biosynthesis
MKITIAQGAFFPVPPLRGGAVEKIWFALGREFARRGHEVTHVSRAFGDLPREDVIGNVRNVRVRGFDTPRSLALLKTFDLLYSLRVLRVLPRADILVTHTFWLPLLIRSHRFGGLYVHAARYPKGQMRFYSHAARLQTVSQPIKDAIIAEAPGCRERIACIPNPLPEAAYCEALPPANAREKHLLYVGRVHPEKGLELLIRAITLIPDAAFAGWKLMVVGPAEDSAGGGGAMYLSFLKDLARTTPHRVAWIGPVYDPPRLAEYYRASSLFVYPSLAERGETFGLAPLEAMSHGCPALVSDLACFRDFIEDETNGFVFNHRGVDADRVLAQKLTRLIGEAAQFDQARAAAAAKAKEFTVERIAGLYLRDFQSLCAPPALSERENLQPEIAL